MMAGINEYPLEYRRMIYKRIEAATGESAEKIEKAYAEFNLQMQQNSD